MQTDPQNILRSVDIVFQVMAKASDRHGGLFPAVAERFNGQILMDLPLPPIIPGQRNSDRSPRGCNLQHDIELLTALRELGETLDRPRYLAQRENYLRTFATVCCPPSPTGLLPWGEHAFWDLYLRRIGNSYLLQYFERPLEAGIETHHQLFPLPADDWRVIHDANPSVLPRFADGLDWHWMDEARTKFNRHGPITQFIRGYQEKRHEAVTGKPAAEATGSDFPSAAGVFIHDYAAAIALTNGHAHAGDWRAAMMRFSDSWWDRRDPQTDLCPKSGSSNPLAWNGASLSQTLSLAVPTLQAADMLAGADDERASTLRQRGEAYVRGILAVEQPQADDGRLITGFNPDGSPFSRTQPWASNRGQASTAAFAVQLLTAASLVDDAAQQRAVELLQRAASPYHEQRCPRNQIVKAADPGAVIELCTQLARHTGESAWQQAAMMHATDALELFFDCPLPRCATGRSHYESQLGSGKLVLALARLAMAGLAAERA